MTKEETIEWTKSHIPFAIKPKRKAKTQFISPFTSYYAMQEVATILGEQFYELQNEIKGK